MANTPVPVNINHSPEALTQSEKIFRLMVESVQDYAIFLLDSQGMVMTWNAGAQRFKGYQPEEIIGRHFSAFYSPEDIMAGKPRWELEQAVKQGRIEDSGWRLRKDGTRFWANVIITALFDRKRILRGFCKVTRDLLPDQKMAEEQLRQSEERLRLMVESVWDYSIYMLDERVFVASWNIGAERAKGYRASEIIGKHFCAFYVPEDIQGGKPQKNLETAIKEGHCLDEGWRVRKDGTTFWASVVITPVKDKDGRLRGFAKVTRDMTDKKREAEELEGKVLVRTSELAKKNKELEQFAYVASHDLQEPLRMVSNCVDLLNFQLGSKLNEEEKELIQFGVEGTERAQLLIRDLLEFAQTGRRGNIRPTDLNETMKQVLANLKIMLVEGHAEVEAGPLPTINADPTQITQLLQNLVANGHQIPGRKTPARPDLG